MKDEKDEWGVGIVGVHLKSSRESIYISYNELQSKLLVSLSNPYTSPLYTVPYIII